MNILPALELVKLLRKEKLYTCREAVLTIFREWSVSWHHGVPAPDPGPGLAPCGTPPPCMCYQLEAGHPNPLLPTNPLPSALPFIFYQ